MAGSCLRPAMVSGRTMLSRAFRVGTRLSDWKMNPTFSRRSRVSWRSFNWPNSYPPIKVCPEVSRSSPARQWRRRDGVIVAVGGAHETAGSADEGSRDDAADLVRSVEDLAGGFAHLVEFPERD